MRSNDQLRHDGRYSNQLRSVSFSYNVFDYAAGSVLFKLGKNKILCAVTMQNNVPSFLRGKGMGWLTSEYALFPAATAVRTPRETQTRRSGRSIEISRFIGRSLRAVIDLNGLGERTIVVDCDVLQADGGTRTACITAAYLALVCAQEKWLKAGLIEQTFLCEGVAAISVGVLNDLAILDLDYVEDSTSDADFNFVISQSGSIIEIQGGVEKKPISWHLFDDMRLLAVQGAGKIFSCLKNGIDEIGSQKFSSQSKNEDLSLFSLKRRQLNL